MSTTPSVYFYSVCGPLPRPWDLELKESGIRLEKVSSAAAVKTRLQVNPDIILVFRYAADQLKGFQVLKKFLHDEALHGMPIIVVGEEADSLEKELTKVFRVALSINEPTDAAGIKRAIEMAASLAKERSGKGEEKQEEPAQPETAAAAAETAVPEVNQPEEPKPLGTRTPFADMLFEFLRVRKIDQMVLGGGRYVTANRADTIVNELVEPLDPARPFVDKVLAANESWVRHHLGRSAYMTDRILRALGLNDIERKVAVLAALTRAHGFKSNPRLLRTDYLRCRDGSVKREIAECLRASARGIATEMRNPHASMLIGVCAKIMAGENISRSSEHFAMASGIIVSDMIDRVCWNMGFFNSLRAYLLLRRWKEAIAADHDFGVLCCAAKFLSEGIVSVPFKHMVPRKSMLGIPKKAGDTDVTETEVELPGMAVPLEALAPGMFLAHPLQTRDGKELLEPNTKLDEDLVWRIWQLASIRPLHDPRVFAAREEQAQSPAHGETL